MEIQGEQPNRQEAQSQDPEQATQPDILNGATLPAPPSEAKSASPETVAVPASGLSKSDLAPKTEPQAANQLEAKQEEAEPASGKQKWSPEQYYDPKPFGPLIKVLGVANEWLMLRGLPIIREIPLLNRLPMGRGLLKFVDVDIPKADLKEFRRVVNPGTAAFLSPNHPEFVTDWMIDKEVSRRVSPLMAHWADKAIVNMSPLTQKFWLANNLISNVRKGGGKEYSIDYALKGHGVLLHPEGMVSWSGNKVYQIYPGIVDMAVETALKAKESELHRDRPAYIVPFVSKYRFVEDVSRGLKSEMRQIEKRLELPIRADLQLQDRFFEMLKNILEKQEKRFNLPEAKRADPINGSNYFARQQALHDHLASELDSRYGAAQTSGHRRIFQLEELVRKNKDGDPQVRKDDFARLKEMRRLFEFSQDLYGREMLTQEEIAECLKRTKRDLVNATTLERVSNYIPIAVGPRVAHVRIAEPIDVSEMLEKCGGDSPQLRQKILEQVRENMQSRLDRLDAELQPKVSRYSRPNPFYPGSQNNVH